VPRKTYTFRDKEYTLSQLAKLAGLSPNVLWYRLERVRMGKMTMEQAVHSPLIPKSQVGKLGKKHSPWGSGNYNYGVY
jgi:hypothetical protein